MIPNPMAHSIGVFQKDTMMRKRQARTKLIGSRMLTCDQRGEQKFVKILRQRFCSFISRRNSRRLLVKFLHPQRNLGLGRETGVLGSGVQSPWVLNRFTHVDRMSTTSSLISSVSPSTNESQTAAQLGVYRAAGMWRPQSGGRSWWRRRSGGGQQGSLAALLTRHGNTLQILQPHWETFSHQTHFHYFRELPSEQKPQPNTTINDFMAT